MPTPRIQHPEEAWEAESRRAQRALLTAERDTLASLDAASRRATEGVLLAIGGLTVSEGKKLAALAAVQRAAEQLRTDTTAAVQRGRAAARAGALDRLVGELQAAGATLGAERLEAPPPSDAAEDAPLAQAAGESLAGAWRAGVAAAVLAWADDPRLSLAERVREVARAHGFRRRRIAATEVPRAYNDEHLEGTAWVAANYTPAGQRVLIPPALGPARGPLAFGRALARDERLRRAFRQQEPSRPAEALRRGPGDVPLLPDADVLDADEAPVDAGLPAWARPLVGRLVKVWNAALDARTCPFCRSMHGAITLLGRPYPNGYEPGGPHPNCRCMNMLVVLTPEIIRANERRAAQKARAVLAFEKQLPQQARDEAARRALVRVKR
ncbi:hypothetical protein [Sorangium sp. So ce233]|uniref:hypothetical protein n=1 Tax=Sorangium sp. So ce233 TaxID=3133290 RepID=UPI003F647DC0